MLKANKLKLVYSLFQTVFPPEMVDFIGTEAFMESKNKEAWTRDFKFANSF